MTDYSFILSKNYSDKQWSMNGDDYDGLVWLDSSEKPTQEELDQQYLTYQNTIAYSPLRRQTYTDRGSDYDSMIVALWEYIIENRPEAANALQSIRLQVKADIPKPI